MNVLLPRQIGGVKILERLGEGGMAFVHRAEDLFNPERALAVKFLRAETSADSELAQRFLREGEVLKRLSHPHLVEVYDFGRAGRTPYILMELLPGGSVKACRGEAPARILRRLLPVADALRYTHESGVIHRDLKPSNLLFAEDGRLKVTDFGVCLWEGSEGTRVTRSQMVVGTLGYMAPEQHGDPRRVDGRCDVYALGAILYEFCTGQSYSQIQLPPAAVRPGFPLRLAGLLMRSLSADPARRTPSMGVFQQELAGWLESAEAAGWGEEPLPGWRDEDRDEETVSRVKAVNRPQSPEERLAPYLDALQTGGVGARRAAAEGLRTVVMPSDETFLLEAMGRASEGARFALVLALGQIGGSPSLVPLLSLLEDPFARAEAAEALSLIALRTGQGPEILGRLQEGGLGNPWRWVPRARLGDEAWVEALESGWEALAPPLKLQALEASRLLPEPLRGRVKALTRDLAGRSSHQRQVWEGL
ncbi:serine/threonine-protein kinase [Holophaga foetida]|uniref:serine/threonine-protein kinase n=1 Tax=Holophaga foetida TaxID=35839 RepID=UPI0002472ABF|nr:serine/threonine-protein kinase [Holophaga foetida]